ncbi:hypothetical protein [Nannocystis punicea]|uniref:Uncharacterized protein n=1 Tax=Nannocystis punicea TaxID=2995304 RepID=A0ABY7GW23_9BACT|nr:hypothetical protein [Nannocystis poenicansa]WAS91014.1 hypothetical protein O0S08_32905 [Nannocystis poenicansa]
MLPAALASLLLAELGWLELRWPEVAGCPAAAEVVAAAERLAAVGDRRPVVAEAAIAVVDTGYSLELSVRAGDEVEQRRVQHASCGPLADATAVIVAVASEPDGSATSRPARDDEIPPGLRRTPAPAVRAPPAVGGFVAAVGALGPPRRPAPGLQAGLAVVWPGARLEFRFHHTFASPLRVAEAPAAGLELQLSAAAIRGCPRWSWAAWSLHLCGGLELGALTARGFGFTTRNVRSTGLWAAGVVGTGAQWRRRWFALGADVEAVLAFTQRGYAVADGAALLYRVPPVGLRFGASVAVFFF